MTGALCTSVYAGSRSVGGLEGIGQPTAIFTTGTGLTTSAACIATPLGGTPPYTYAWVYSGPPGITLNAPTLASTTASATLGPGDLIRGFATCTVRDTNLLTVATNPITLQFQYG